MQSLHRDDTSKSDEARPLGILALAVWFGIVTGCFEATVRAFREWWVAGVPIFTLDTLASPWISALGNLAFSVPIGLGLAVLAAFRLVGLRTAVFVFTFVSLFSLRFATLGIHRLAWFLVLVGIALNAARLAVSHRRAFDAAVRRSLPWMSALVLVIAIASPALPWFPEHRSTKPVPSRPGGPPNVILIVLDTVRAREMSLYGHSRRTTPRLERLAQRGVSFEGAIATCSWTLPSHASMFTGFSPGDLSVNWTSPLDARRTTLAEALDARGYETAGFAANRICDPNSGLARGFAHYEAQVPGFYTSVQKNSYLFMSLTTKLSTWRVFRPPADFKNAARMNADVLSWFKTRSGRPYFAFINYIDAHAPFVCPPPFDRRFATAAVDPPRPREASAQSREVAANHVAYDGCIAYLDDQVGRLMDELERLGQLANTMVIITSDHGEQFGEHGLDGHGNSLYIPLLHVPLLVLCPGKVPEGRTVSAGVSLGDIPATVMDLVGAGDGSPFPGQSLARHWVAGDPAASNPLVSEISRGVRTPPHEPVSRGDMGSIVRGRYHYIKNGDGQEELYDWHQDPDEEHDLASLESSRPILNELRAALPADAIRLGLRGRR